MPILVDSSVWIHFFRGTQTPQTNYLYANLGEIDFVTGDLILAEVLQGFRTGNDFREAKKALLSFEVFRMTGEENAIRSAQNFRYLRDSGFTVFKIIHCLIATFCISKNFALLHSDRNFDPFEKLLDLRVIQTASDSLTTQ